ncbi:MAG: DUF3179 domain-containing (seleno)protein, partial [Alphaproteobacteria bacterium]|nr:DUF3179 domain-containing (seleno)protein [Alphaproteobacteria bacterium]
GSGAVYRDYFASPELMFPARVDQRRLAQKDRVFGIRTVGAAKAWPLATFRGGRVINDQIGDLPLVLIGDADRRTVRAYRRGNGRFRTGDAPNTLSGPGGTWTVGEENLLGPAGEKLARMPGHIAYWFAWNNYLGPASELAGER